MCPLYPDPGRDKYFPDADDIATLLATCAGENRIRDTALILFATATGARRFEIASVEVADVEFDTPLTNLDTSAMHTGFVHLRTVKRDTTGRMKPRYSMFDSATGLMLKAWIRTAGIVEGSLFGLTDNGIQLMVRRIAHDAGLPRAHPHAFRAALIDYWREVNATSGPMADIALKLQVGHSLKGNSDVTMVYQNLADWRRNRERIRVHYRSPVELLSLDWSRYPVHIVG
jgi:integrase